MIIPVLAQLNSRSQWINFFRRESSYCFVETPECLVDLQTNYLQLTVLSAEAQGRSALKYSLGSRTSIEPAWQLIKSCRWDLTAIITGLEQLDFSSNVRDNSLLMAHTDLTVRKFYCKDRLITAPGQLGLIQPLTEAPSVWLSQMLLQLLSNEQYLDLRAHPSNLKTPPAEQLLLDILHSPNEWLGKFHQGRLYLLQQREAVASLIIDLRVPKPKLRQHLVNKAG